MTKDEATAVLESMEGNIRFFPSKPAAQSLIVAELADLCETFEQGKQLARRMCQIYREWPGLSELRTAYSNLQCERQGFIDPGCPDCAGSGWKIVEKSNVSGVRRCGCGSVPRDPGIVLDDFKRHKSTGLLGAKDTKFLRAALDPDEEERLRVAEQEKISELDAEVKQIANEQAEQRKPRTKAEIEEMLYRPRITAEEVERAREAELARRKTREKEDEQS